MIQQPPFEESRQTKLAYQEEGINIDKLNNVLGDIELTPSEERILIWLAGWEQDTVDNIISVIKKVVWSESPEKNLNYNDLAVICKNKLTLKEARIAAGISQAELAKRSGVKKCSISSYEQNRTSFNKIAFGTVKKFAEALNIPMECLESDEE